MEGAAMKASDTGRYLLAAGLVPVTAWALRDSAGPFDGTPFEQPFLLPVMVTGVAVVVFVALMLWARR